MIADLFALALVVPFLFWLTGPNCHQPSGWIW